MAYEWAQNKLKLNRAVAEATKEAKENKTAFSEERVKEIYIKNAGFVIEAPEEEVTDIEEMTLSQLKKHAKDNAIELGDATTKADILEVIKAAQA